MENTEIAFRYKSDEELRKAYWLFRLVANPKLVKIGSRFLSFFNRLGISFNFAIKPTVFEHFCGGYSLEDCITKVERLAKYNVRSILDYSVEGKESDEEIQAGLEETLRSIRFAGKNKNIPFAVFKPTGFGLNSVLKKKGMGEELTPEEEVEAQKFRDRIDILCKTAYEEDTPILIDAEDYWYQDFIDEMVIDMVKRYNKKRTIVFQTYQMYRWDRLDALKKDLETTRVAGVYLGAKFVRGAYMEKERERARQGGYPDPIQPDKEHTDRDYDAALKFSVENIDRISVFNGTHNEKSSLYLAELMKKHGLANNDPRLWFSQLYGMSDHISFNLGHAGYNVAKYVPYGPVKWVIPYLIRRAEENTSVEGQTGRELSLLIKERKRRKAEK